MTFELEVLVGGAPLAKYAHSGDEYVSVPLYTSVSRIRHVTSAVHGEFFVGPVTPYTVRVRNTHATDTRSFFLTLDGRDVSPWSWICGPGTSHTFRGFETAEGIVEFLFAFPLPGHGAAATAHTGTIVLNAWTATLVPKPAPAASAATTGGTSKAPPLNAHDPKMNEIAKGANPAGATGKKEKPLPKRNSGGDSAEEEPEMTWAIGRQCGKKVLRYLFPAKLSALLGTELPVAADEQTHFARIAAETNAFYAKLAADEAAKAGSRKKIKTEQRLAAGTPAPPPTELAGCVVDANGVYDLT